MKTLAAAMLAALAIGASGIPGERRGLEASTDTCCTCCTCACDDCDCRCCAVDSCEG